MATVHRFSGTTKKYEWQGIEPRKYNDHELAGVVMRILIGKEDGATNFVMRYFQIEPGGHSRLERHPHDHGVIILHGKAKVQLNDEAVELDPLDVVHVAGNDLHQFSNIGEDLLGFICVIPPID